MDHNMLAKNAHMWSRHVTGKPNCACFELRLPHVLHLTDDGLGRNGGKRAQGLGVLT
jgi:hypothetical protein